jgi:hypothetical protein
MNLLDSVAKPLNLELKSCAKQLLGSLPIVFALPELTQVLPSGD